MNPMTTFSTFVHFARVYPWRTVLMLASLVIAGLSESIGIITLLPFITLTLDDHSSQDSPVHRMMIDTFDRLGIEPTVGTMLAIIVAAIGFKAVMNLVAMRQVGFTVSHVATDLRLSLLRSLMSARWEHFTAQSVGELANAMGMEATRASMAYWAVCGALAVIIQVALYIAAAFVVSWQVTLLSLVVGVLAVLLLQGLVRQARAAGREQTRLMKNLSGRFADTLIAIKPLKAMAREDRLTPLIEDTTHELNDIQRRQVMSKEILLAMQQPIVVAFLAAGIYLALNYAQMGMASLLVMAVLFQRIVSRIGNVQVQYQNVALSESAFWSIRSAIERAAQGRERNDGNRPPSLQRGIELREITFRHGDNKILSSVSLYIPVRGFTAIVGPSGSGKTTLVDLILALYQPQSGKILVDGVPLDEIDIRAWRRGTGYVPQENVLLHDTLMKNVTLNDPMLTSIDAEAALRAAGALEFVAGLPEGMNTVVGERGSRLSGGQRQRIAIARALVNHPKLLILDEATSGLDPDTERAILTTLKSIAGEITVIAISHNPAVAEAADMVYRLENGRVGMVKCNTTVRNAMAVETRVL